MATRVSYLEDQALRRDQMGRTVPNYYEEIIPAPGRPNNRYRLEHIPFVTAMKSPGWSESPILGQGPDYFYKHLQQARRQLPDGQTIPENLPVIWQALWIVIALGAAIHLARQYTRMAAGARADRSRRDHRRDRQCREPQRLGPTQAGNALQTSRVVQRGGTAPSAHRHCAGARSAGIRAQPGLGPIR